MLFASWRRWALAAVILTVWPAAAAPLERPAVLSDADAHTYQRIFQAQAAGQFDRADKLIADVKDKVLLGYVQFQRLMHPRYRARFSELQSWMDKYADLPGAERIFALAKRRAPNKRSAVDTPEKTSVRWGNTDGIGYDLPDRRSDAYRAHERKVREMMQDDAFAAALAYIDDKRKTRDISGPDRDALRLIVATAQFLDGQDADAYALANTIAHRNRAEVPAADWTAGLAAFRLGNYAEAGRHFERLSAAPDAGDWTRAGAAFWAARGHLAARQPQKVTPLLEIAAARPHTFYGLLAERQLGLPKRRSFPEPPLDQATFALLIESPPIRRAVALAQAGETDKAGEELLRGHGRANADLDEGLIALAGKLELPEVQHQIAARTGSKGYLAALYPVLRVEPEGGFRVDPALIMALVKTESRFDAKAESGAGAMGLMQITPATAAHISGDESFTNGKAERLLDPKLNITLGQRYVQELMGYGEPDGNLYQFAAAYNAGPGNLQRWLSEVDAKGDPLLFIESIPARETRAFIERLLVHYWMYSERMGARSATLDQAAANAWPVASAAPQRGGLFGIRLP